jgi:hypothetical protein
MSPVVLGLSTASVVLVSSVLFSNPTFAENPFDGAWQVVVSAHTPKPRCKGRSIALRVDNGTVKVAGLLGGFVKGKVESSGELSAQLARIEVSGKLENDEGAGFWQSPNCNGTWSAHREPKM